MPGDVLGPQWYRTGPTAAESRRMMDEDEGAYFARGYARDDFDDEDEDDDEY